MVLYLSTSLNEEKHPGNLLKEQWLWIWPTSVYWWVSYMNEKVAFCDKHRYRLCKKITWVYIILVYMHHTKLCIVAITEIHFYEKIPNVRRYIKTKPLPLLTPLKVHCLYTFVSRIINISITGGVFSTASTLFITFLSNIPFFDNWKDRRQSVTCSLMVLYTPVVTM